MNISDSAMEASGNVTVQYKYNHNWSYDDGYISKTFTAKYKSSAEPKISNDDIQKVILSKDITWNRQSINVTKEKITGFKVTGDYRQSKGTRLIKDCEFNITEPWGKFHVNSSVIYDYNGLGWNVSSISEQITVMNVDISGKWDGKYYNGLVSYDLKQSADGMITGTCNFTTKDNVSGSYTIAGSINFDTFKVILNGQEWTNKPTSGWGWTFYNVTNGVLNVNSAEIYYSSDFSVKK